MKNIRIFNDEEIGEINSYVVNQIPQSILPSLFVLSEEPLKKTKAFVAIYRIMSGAKEFIEKKETCIKVEEYISDVKEVYNKLYELLLDYEETGLEITKYLYFKKIKQEIFNNNYKINFFINSFLVFAEKQELISTDSMSGIKLDKDEGVDAYNKIADLVED